MKKTIKMTAVMTTDLFWEGVADVPDDADDDEVVSAITEVIDGGDFKEADLPFAGEFEIVGEELLTAPPDAEPTYFLARDDDGDLEVLP